MVDQFAQKELIKQVVFRHLRKTDLPELEWNGEFTHFRKLYADAFIRSEAGFLIAWVVDLPGTGIIGQAFVQLICDRLELANGLDRAYLYAIRVKPEYRCNGIGKALLQTIERDLYKRRVHFATLNVAKDNPRAQKLYESCGYQVVAHEPGIWSYPDEKGVWHQVVQPAWRMEKVLVAES
ncbi:MAG: GNAT family N-acetyltransferase [Anaerolineaceae bacterium]